MKYKSFPASLTGLRVGLFPFGTEGNPYQRLIAEALTVAGFAPRPLPKQNWFALRRVMSQPIDVLQMHWPHSLYHGRSWLATILKRAMYFDGLHALERKPVMYSADNLLPHDAADPAFEMRMVQRLLDRVDGCLVASRASSEIFCRTYRLPPRVKCHVVPHRNYLGAYPNTMGRDEARRRLNLPAAARVVLFFGRLLWYKGIEGLLPAFLQLDDPNAILVLAGQPRDGSFVAALEQQVAKHRQALSGQVRVDARFVPDDEIQLYMNAADLVALPYADVPMNPGSLILAMGFGKPVISPAKGATPEIAGPNVLFGYDEGQPGGLAATLRRALGADDLAARGSEALDRARTNHSKDRVAAAYRAAYESTAASLTA